MKIIFLAKIMNTAVSKFLQDGQPHLKTRDLRMPLSLICPVRLGPLPIPTTIPSSLGIGKAESRNLPKYFEVVLIKKTFTKNKNSKTLVKLANYVGIRVLDRQIDRFSTQLFPTTSQRTRRHISPLLSSGGGYALS